MNPGWISAGTNAMYCTPYTLKCLIGKIIEYLQIGILLIISLAVVTFAWNVYRYFFKADADKKEAGLYVLYSTIGLFVILSFWGLVAILSNTLNLPNTQPMWPIGGGSAQTTSRPWVPSAGSNRGGGVPSPGSNMGSGVPSAGSNTGGGIPSAGSNFYNSDPSSNFQTDTPYDPDQDQSSYYRTDIPADPNR